MGLRARTLVGVAIAVAITAAPATAARTYKWVDDEGVTHYSQYPPPDGEAKIIEPSIGIPSSASGEESGGDASGTTAAAGAEGDDGPQTMDGYCKQLREQAQLLASDRDVRVRQDDGSLTALAGDARASKRAELEQQIQQFCN